jgi:ribosome-binding protein aMBF1 (putative translation factor)
MWSYRQVAEKQLYGRKGLPLSEREMTGLRDLGTVLKRARLGLGWSQRGLERRSGVDQTTISRLENGRLVNFSLQRLASLIQALRGRFDINDFD